ncbi:unnamed protein product [Didymodactylos carnosus]|uniref:FLYWCH-type domain-containing protein n=1 Tax=Didymodactylos carnosus TaxID=1234261 RepID=A0A8S2YBA0_9BILA|nr:unnamed protein product [Didymodactylos carnosus]
MFSIVESKRKKPVLLFDTFRYTQDKIVGTTIYWKCEDRSCPGRAVQYGSAAPNLKKSHNHNGDENKCKAEEFKMAVKRRIEHSPQPVKRIYKQELTSLYTTSPQIAPSIPMFHEIKNSLYKTRNDSYPPAPYTTKIIHIITR